MGEVQLGQKYRMTLKPSHTFLRYQGDGRALFRGGRGQDRPIG